MDINEYINANLHLPKPLRSREAQLHFTSFFYDLKSKERLYLFQNVSLNDLAYFTFDVYFKEMFRYGYKLTSLKLKTGFTALPLDAIIKRLIENDYTKIAYRGITAEDYDKIVDGLVYSKNLDKYRKDYMYFPADMRDFHFQKSLFKMFHDKHKSSDISVSYVQSHMFITDFIHHYLAYSGLVLRAARNKFEFKDIYSDITDFDAVLRNQSFPLS